MSVPTYSKIDDNEIDPESPITSSLMTRLRNNVLALLGVDTTASSPAVVFQPSFIQTSDVGVTRLTAKPSGSTDSAETVISRVASTFESVEIVRGRSDDETPWTDTIPQASWAMVDGAVFAGNGNAGDILAIDINYSSGVPSTATIRYSLVGTPRTTTSLTVAIDGAYHTFRSSYFNAQLQVKFRALSGLVYMQWRSVEASGDWGLINITHIVRKYVNKLA